MAVANRKSDGRPRELRRRVVIPARIRTGSDWGDACILNISSRGLMIQSHRAGAEGSLVELRRGDHVIVARVVWRQGARAGLRSEERLAVEQIMSLSSSTNLRLVASEGTFVERRSRPRTPAVDARTRGRMVEFAGIAAFVLTLCVAVGTMAQHALAEPMVAVETALSGH